MLSGVRQPGLAGAVYIAGLVLASCNAAPPAGQSCASGAVCPALTKEQLMDPVVCSGCHQSYYDDWSASMHAYAADDPLFIAMNQRGQDQAQVGTFCVNCHAPMAVRLGLTTDGTNLASLPQSMKGVTCYYCHTTDAVLDSHTFVSGEGGFDFDAGLGVDASAIYDDSLRFANDGVMRGSYSNAVPNVAHASAYSTLHDGTHLESAQLCGACHDVVNAHGAEIEATYHEWTQTLYDNTSGGNTCGQCHMHKSTGIAATVQGAPARAIHEHKFPGVDTPLAPAPGVTAAAAGAQQQAVQTFLSTELAMSLCVRGIPGGSSASLFVVLDNVASGHRWPSGAAQDRRAWVEIHASVAGASIYESGVVPAGTDPTDLSDPDLWLLRECMLDSQGGVVHTFWDAYSSDSNELPGPVTSNPLDPGFYQTHVMQTYPRASSTMLTAYPDTATAEVHLLAFPPDLFDDLFATPAEIGLTADAVQALRSNLTPVTIGSPITWTQDAANDAGGGGSFYFDQGIPVFCVSTGGLNPQANKVPAQPHSSPACKP
jgi:hypothetical protein